MAITNSTAAKDAATAAVCALVDQGAEDHGTLEIRDTDGVTVLVVFDLPNPAFGAPADGVATADAIDDATAVAAGTAASYAVKDADGAVVWSGTVSLAGGGGDMVLDNLSINTGQSVSITSWTHTALSQ